MLHLFKKKTKKNACRYHYQNLDDLIYSSWDIKHTGHFFPFYPPKNLQNQNFEKLKKLLEISSFYTCIKNHNYMMYGSWDTEWDGQNFFVILGHFSPFYHTPPATPLMIPKIKILKKKWKECLEILSFYTYMCTINDDDIWFLKYKVRQTEIFVILGHVLSF